MTRRRLRPGPWTCTLLAAAGIALLVAGAGYVVDDDGLTRWCIRRTETRLATRFWSPSSIVTLQGLVERMETQTGVTIDVDWPSFKRYNVTPDTACWPAGLLSPLELISLYFGEVVKDRMNVPRAMYRAVMSIDRAGQVKISAKPDYFERRYDLTFMFEPLDVTATREIFKTLPPDQQVKTLQQIVHNVDRMIPLSLIWQCKVQQDGKSAQVPSMVESRGIVTVRATRDHHQFIREALHDVRLGQFPLTRFLEALWGE